MPSVSRSQPSSPALRFIPPLMPTVVDQPPKGDAWLHEVKHDGYRTCLVGERGKARAFTRNGHDWSKLYKRIVEAAAAFPVKAAILDGEAFVQNERTRRDGSGGEPVRQQALTRAAWRKPSE